MRNRWVEQELLSFFFILNLGLLIIFAVKTLRIQIGISIHQNPIFGLAQKSNFKSIF